MSKKEEDDENDSLSDSELIVVDDADDHDALSGNKTLFENDPNDCCGHLHQLKKVKKENKKLKRYLKSIINCGADLMNKPLIQVIFRKRKLARKYRSYIESFLQEVIDRDKRDSSINRENEDDHEISTLNIHGNFFIDNIQTPERSPALEPFSSLPLYDKEYQETLQESSDTSPTKSLQSKPRSFLVCFNCLGNHALANCDQKIDRKKVAKNRRKQYNSMGPRKNLISGRYHVVKKQKSECTPGVISDELRSAMGIEANELPPYIYRMRLLGYPPGWFEEAHHEKNSGLVMYDTDGKAMKEEVTEGSTNTGESHGCLNQKLYGFPGFNVPPPSDVIDDWESLRMPPMQLHDLISYAESNQKSTDVKPQRKRKLSNPRNSRYVKIPRLEEDMEIEDVEGGKITLTPNDYDDECRFIPPLPPEDDALPPLPPEEDLNPPLPPDVIENSALPPLPPENSEENGIPPPLPLDENESSQLDYTVPYSPGEMPSSLEYFENADSENNNEEMLSRTSSPSITDLEIMKLRLMRELEEADSFENDDPSFDSVSNEVVEANSEHLSQSSESVGYASENSDVKKRSNSLSVTFGTPVVSSHSLFSKLPDRSKFSKGVTDYLPFENLPNSTGKFDKMKTLLSKVREKVKRLQE